MDQLYFLIACLSNPIKASSNPIVPLNCPEIKHRSIPFADSTGHLSDLFLEKKTERRLTDGIVQLPA
jgi:hypothetical protein